VPLEDSHAAMLEVDGVWWDSSKKIPDWTLVTRRQFADGPLLSPWRLEDATRQRVGWQPLRRADAAPVLGLRVQEGCGRAVRGYATAEFGCARVEAGFPLPRPIAHRHGDFPAIVAAMRAARRASGRRGRS
jgi:hypothetical protein